MASDPKNLVRTSALRPQDATHLKHPMNPNSEIFMHRLSDHAGIERLHMNIARIPPGKESFLPHAHTFQEEWVFVLEGAGTAVIDGDDVAIGGGDYLGFPTDGTTHHLKNTGVSDLVVLQGGERTPREIGRFPTIGKTALFEVPKVTFYGDDGTVEELHLSRWVVTD
ncbi:MAG: cupin domain-containing protein [Alphaproteobacteria bacterium]|nr:cupin domain-containing protein [Alphaproteobacteria bacterium]